MPEPTIRLVPFTRDWLSRIEPWFEHPEVQRWLGGPDWPALVLRLETEFVPGGEFRGAIGQPRIPGRPKAGDPAIGRVGRIAEAAAQLPDVGVLLRGQEDAFATTVHE
jgi:hypothetical protein